MVSLSAIRRVEYQGVSTGLDAVERSLKAVSAAGDKVVQSGEAVTRTTERQEKRQLSLAGAVDRLQRQLDMAFRQQAEFERHQRTMNNALEQGVIDAERYGGVMASLSAKYDYAGQAARAAAARVHDLSMKFDEGYAAARRMDQAVAELAEAERAGVRITGGYAAAIDAVILSHDKAAQAAARQATELRALAEAERLAATQADGQSKWNSYAGVNRASAGSARDSAAVFEAAARAEDEMARAAENLRAKIDPLGTAQARMNAELAEYQQMLARGVITSRNLPRRRMLRASVLSPFRTRCSIPPPMTTRPVSAARTSDSSFKISAYPSMVECRRRQFLSSRDRKSLASIRVMAASPLH